MTKSRGWPKWNKTQIEITKEQRAVAHARTAFLHRGSWNMTLNDLLANAYIQGIIDAAHSMPKAKEEHNDRES